MALAAHTDPSDAHLAQAYATLLATRPTAVNLRWALDHMCRTLQSVPLQERAPTAWRAAGEICEQDVAANKRLGAHGLELIAALARHKGGAVNIMTHCNAGWLATVDYGTALAPIYLAFDAGVPLHVWVSETRPRNQGAALTAWELAEHGVPHSLIVDNAAGHLMRRGLVDIVIVGADRVSPEGDVANKIGTYLKALAARDNALPFYVAVPSSSMDWKLTDAQRNVPIEERDGAEVSNIEGVGADGAVTRVRIAPERTPVSNFGFDLTPARLVTGLITERGVCPATRAGLAQLFPEHQS
jgi:methylthioribose-1-phosphate isomerase